MADAGISDILITYNLIGAAKMARLAALRQRIDIKVVADSIEVVQGLSEAMSAAGLMLPVMVECDTGARRCGVVEPEDAARLGVAIARAPGLRFHGLMTYPPHGGIAAANAWIDRALEACRREVLEVEVVSGGGTPDLAHAHELHGVTEHRPGTYIYNDRSLVERGACGWEDCALTVAATVVSHPSPDRCIIDAGSKSLSSDTLGLSGHGRILEYPALQIAGLSEEHGHVAIPAGSAAPRIGERVSVIPDHACVVTNLHDRVYGARGGRIERVFEISARGRTQ